MIIVDIETSGLDPYKHDIVSIGAVLLEDESKTFYIETRIRENREIDDFALSVNGFTKEEIIDLNKPLSKDGVGEFQYWAQNLNQTLLAGHNIGQFDAQFLINAAPFKWMFGHRYVDLHSVLYAKFKKSFKADEGYEILGISTEPKPHNALTGAIWERKAFVKLLN